MSYTPKHMAPRGVAPYASRSQKSEVPTKMQAVSQSQELTLEQDLEQERSSQVQKNAAMMSVLVIISRLTGFVRTWAQAYALGVTVVASCYSLANNLPNMLYELVIGGMLVTAFLPVYLQVKKNLGQKGANAYTSNLISLVLVFMGGITVLSIIFAYPVVFTQSFSATSEFDTDLAVYFFRFFAIEVLLYSLSSIFSGVLNAHRDYVWSNAAPIFNNFVVTASFLAYAFLSSTNPQVALLLLALGNPLGVAVQVIMQLPSLKKHGIKFSWHINLRDPALKDTLGIGIPSLVIMLCSFVTVSVMTSSALSVTPVGASVSYYARLWYTLPYAILVVPITTTMFTELSLDVAHGNFRSFCAGVASGIEKILFFMVPFGLYLSVFSLPLITLLAAGNFSAEEISITAQYLITLALNLPFYGICMYLQKVSSALKDMKLYTIANVVAAVVQVLICVYVTPLFGLNVVGLSSLAFMVVVDVITLGALRHELSDLRLGGAIKIGLEIFVFGILGAVVGYFIASHLSFGISYLADTTSIKNALLFVICGGIPAVLVTYLLAFAFKMPQIAVVQTLIQKFAGRRASK